MSWTFWMLLGSAFRTEDSCDPPSDECCSSYDMMQDTGMALSGSCRRRTLVRRTWGTRVDKRHDSAARRSRCDTHLILSLDCFLRLPDNRNLRLSLRHILRRRCCMEYRLQPCSQQPSDVCEGSISWTSRSQIQPSIRACITDSARVHINGYDPGSSTSHEKQNCAARMQKRIVSLLTASESRGSNLWYNTCRDRG